MRRGIVAALAALLVPAAPAVAQAPFGTHTCAPLDEDVLRCTGAPVPSWDGVPLDLDVLLPARRDGAVPLVAIAPGFPGGVPPAEGAYILPDPAGLARRGAAVLLAAPRGTFGSCGLRPSSLREACATGWAHIADARYEGRDLQHLAGLLADQGIVDGRRVAVAGESYGGGIAAQLAVLRDRVRLPDGTYAPWRSPGGRPMRLAAAVALTAWDDLGYGLAPNGRLGSTAPAGAAAGRDPAGVPLASFIGVFAAVSVTGIPGSNQPVPFRAAPPGVDPSADFYGILGRILSGVDARSALDELHANHSAAGLVPDGPAAPTLFVNGVGDDLFGGDHALRFAERARGGRVDVVLADVGHGRSTNDAAHRDLVNARTEAWLERWLHGGRGDLPAGVTVVPSACSPGGEPVSAPSPAALARRELVVEAGAGRVLPVADRHGRELDPVLATTGQVPACAEVEAIDQPGTLAAAGAPVEEPTLLAGVPVLTARITAVGADAQLAARVWDVAPDGRQRLVTRALLRPRTGDERFELRPVAWTLAAGHRLRLELLGADVPWGRPGVPGAVTEVAAARLVVPAR